MPSMRKLLGSGERGASSRRLLTPSSYFDLYRTSDGRCQRLFCHVEHDGTGNGGKLARATVELGARYQTISISGLIGSCRTRTPVAWNTALPMAGPMPVAASPPMPRAPIGLAIESYSSMKEASISGTSAFTGTR